MPIPDMGPGDFILEVVIVVLGVLLALGSEHIVEQIRWHQKASDTTKQLDGEVHSNEVSAYRWLTVHGCLRGQLDAIGTDVRRARHSHLLAPVSEYTPPLEVFLTDAWNNARSLDVADHISPQAMRRYAVLYFFPPQLQIDVVQLHQLAAELDPLIQGEDEVSSAEAGEYQRLLGRIRELQGRIELAETVLLKDGERL
ncbi:MAG: hypothetical protein ABIW33_02490, partial [Sphingomicrobium sp.]